MAINYIYPEADIDSNFGPVGTSTTYQAIANSPHDTSDATYIRGFGTSHWAEVWLGDNGIFPSSVTLGIRNSYNTQTLPADDGLEEPRDVAIIGRIYNASNILIASGMMVDPMPIFEMPLTIYSGVNDLYLPDFLDLKLRLDYYSLVDYTVGFEDVITSTDFRIYAAEVMISGHNLPENNDMALMVMGPCNGKGDIQPVNNYLTISSDYQALLSEPVGDGGFGVPSVRFGIPNFARSFPNESGYVAPGSGEAAFWGNGNQYFGQYINNTDVDGIEFWTNFSSGLLRVSGVGFYEEVPFQSYANETCLFSGGTWPKVEVRVDLDNENADFRFDYASDTPTGNYLGFRPSFSSRTDFIITSSGETNRIDNYSTSSLLLSNRSNPAVIPVRTVNDLVSNNLYYSSVVGSGNGIYKLNVNNEVSNVLYNDNIYDLDICYDNNKLYCITPSSLLSYDLNDGDVEEEHVFSTTLNYPKLSVFDSRRMTVTGLSGSVYAGTRSNDSSPWSFAALAPTTATFQHDIEHRYFTSGYVGALILRDTNLYRYSYDTGFLTHISASAPTGVVDMSLNESSNVLNFAARPRVLLGYNLVNDSLAAGLNTTLPINPNLITSVGLLRNKNYLNTSSGVYSLSPLSKCCDTAPSGFIQLEGLYTDESYFGYAGGRILHDGDYIWRSQHAEKIKITNRPTFSTVGYHNYEIDEDNSTYSSWRDAQIEFKVHNFKNTFGGSVSPTGYLKLDNIEYRYEDCYTASTDEDMDLFLLAGLTNKLTPLYVAAATEDAAGIPLAIHGGTSLKIAPLFVEGFMRTEDEDIPLFILPRDSGVLDDEVSLYVQGGFSLSDSIPLYLFSRPADDMILFIEGTTTDPSSGDVSLFTRSTAEAAVYKAGTLFIDSKLKSDMGLFIKADNGDDTNNMTLYTEGIQLDAIKSTTMMIHNTREAASGDMDMFIAGPPGSGVDDDMTLYVFNDVNGSGPNMVSAIGMVINPGLTVDGSGNSMYIFGGIPTSSGFTLYMPSSIGNFNEDISIYTHGF